MSMTLFWRRLRAAKVKWTPKWRSDLGRYFVRCDIGLCPIQVATGETDYDAYTRAAQRNLKMTKEEIEAVIAAADGWMGEGDAKLNGIRTRLMK